MEYYRPESLEEAVSLLGGLGGSATLIAGGTDIVPAMKFQGFRPAALLNINGLDDLRYMRSNGRHLKIGALTTIRALETDARLKSEFTAISDAARQFASLQIRNLATIGGNLGRASPCGEMAPPLLALNATLVLAGQKGEREVELTSFFLGPGQTVLQPDELLKEICVPVPPLRSGSNYLRLSYRDVLDLAIVGVASSLTLGPDNRTVEQARVALGAVAPRPIRAPKTEALLRGEALTPELLAEAGAMAALEASPISDMRGSAAYRRHVTAVLTRRSLQRAAQAATPESGEGDS